MAEAWTRTLHIGFDDPPRLAAGASSEETALAPYRRVRDEIRAYVSRLPEWVAVPAQVRRRRDDG